MYEIIPLKNPDIITVVMFYLVNVFFKLFCLLFIFPSVLKMNKLKLGLQI